MKNISEVRNIWFISQVRSLEATGINQADVAQKIGILPQYLNSVLMGRRNSSDKLISKLCNAFNINQNDLFENISGGKLVDVPDRPPCELCKKNEELVESLRQQINVLHKLLKKYEDEERPKVAGQKRKAAS